MAAEQPVPADAAVEMEAQADPQSPPLPTRHTAVTPAVKAARFQELYATSLARTLARISWDNFAACYPTVAVRAPGALKTVQTAMVERLKELCHVGLPPFPFPSLIPPPQGGATADSWL